MFAKIKNNEVIEWPVPSITALFPNTSFPSPLRDEDLPEGYYSVGVMPSPQITHLQKIVGGLPILLDGKWTQSWDIVDLTEQELEERISGFAQAVRDERNRLLTESDWTQYKDISNELSTKWAPYRQALRDITNQPGFPHQVTWPTKP